MRVYYVYVFPPKPAGQPHEQADAQSERRLQGRDWTAARLTFVGQDAAQTERHDLHVEPRSVGVAGKTPPQPFPPPLVQVAAGARRPHSLPTTPPRSASHSPHA